MSTLFDSIPASTAAPREAGTGAAFDPPTDAAPTDVEALLRLAFGSWDGYRGLGGVTRQHFTEADREHWRSVYAGASKGSPQ